MRLWILIHTVCLLALCGAVFASRRSLLQPIVGKQQVVQQRVNELNRLLDSSIEVTAQHAELVTSLQDIRRRDTEVRRRIPDESRDDEFLQMLTSTALERNVMVKDYRRQTVVNHNSYNELGVTVSCECGFAELCGLLYDLTTLPRVTHVQQMTVAEANAPDRYAISLTLALFFGATKPEAEVVAAN